jgi:uncharacterized protein
MDTFAKLAFQYVSSSHIIDEALALAIKLNLQNWCIVGGIIRDVVWSSMALLDPKGVIHDIDLIYLDPSDISEKRDIEIEHSLPDVQGINWSVKNQSRMHIKNGDYAYISIQEALYCFPDTISSISISRAQNCEWVISSCFGYEDLCNKIFRPTPHFMKTHSFDEYMRRIYSKRWLEKWPAARVVPW